MNKINILQKTKAFAKERMGRDITGHDWFHVSRVLKNAEYISAQEGGADVFIVQIAALLHDIADWKFNNGSEKAGPELAKKWLIEMHADDPVVDHVCYIIEHVSFKGAKVKNLINTPEGMIVQDADRLDAIGAVGIARTFAYCASVNREIYDPDFKPELHETFQAYKDTWSPTVNGFYERMLLLADKLNTKTARKIATKRHAFVLKYLEQFYREWNGDDLI